MNTKSTLKKALLLAALGFGLSAAEQAPVQAATTDSSPTPLLVSADVTATCTIDAPNALAFGTYDVTAGADLTTTADLALNCSLGAAATITMGQGANAQTGSTAAAPIRAMDAGGSTPLLYNISGVGFGGAELGGTAATGLGYTGTGGADAVTVYGSIPAGQAVESGTYGDSVTVFITY